MRKLMFTAVTLVSLMAFVCSSDAFFSRGDINGDYSYEDLETVVKGKRKKKCYLKGTIINKTGERKEDVKITFYAMTIHDETLWRVKVKVDLIDRYGKFRFEKKIKRVSAERCERQEVYKWEFKIKEPKRRRKK